MPSPDDLAPLVPAMTAWRQDLHRHPELGFEEYRTAAFVAGMLPGAYCWLGTGEPAHREGVHHNPHFDFNDTALTHGAAFWCSLVEQELA